jgi:hypothetical protein
LWRFIRTCHRISLSFGEDSNVLRCANAKELSRGRILRESSAHRGLEGPSADLMRAKILWEVEIQTFSLREI